MGKINRVSAGALAIVLWSGTVSSQTLVEATAFAIGNSPDVAIVKNQYLSRVEQIGQARAGFKPKVDLALGWGNEWTNSPSTRASTNSSDYVDLQRGEASLTMSQLLYDGQRTKNDSDRTNAEDLLEAVLMQSELLELNAPSEGMAAGVVASGQNPRRGCGSLRSRVARDGGSRNSA